MIVRRSAATFALQLAQLTGLAATTILVTRVTGASGKGAYTLVATVLSMATLATGFGVSWAGVYHIGRKVHPPEATASTMIGVGLVTSLISMAAIAVAYIALRTTYFHAVMPAQAVITILIAPMTQMTFVLGYVLMGLNKPVHFAVLLPVQVVTTVCVQLAAALVGRLDATTALLAWLVGATVSLLVALFLARRSVALRIGFNPTVFRSLINYGVRGYVANLSSFFNYRLDSLIINGFVGLSAVGIYSVSVAAAELIWYVSNAVSQVLLPHVSTVDRAAADRVTPILCRNTLFVSLVGAILMALTGRVIIVGLFSTAMLPALVPLWLLLPGVVALSVDKVIASYLSGIGKPIYSSYIAGGTLALTVPLDLLLIPRFGIGGAAAASSTVYIASTFVSLWAYRREAEVRLSEMLIIRIEDLRRYQYLLLALLRRPAPSPAPL
jgi:O-antigen/teichoic acid export membrane protein